MIVLDSILCIDFLDMHVYIERQSSGKEFFNKLIASDLLISLIIQR